MNYRVYIFCLVSALNIYAQPPDYSKININHFVKCSPIEDQQYSSTCWSFASTSFIESEIYRQQNFFYDLSEMYFARYSYFNKVSAYLKSDGRIFFTPGGQFHDVLEVIRKWGICPEFAYPGYTPGTYYHDHHIMDTLVWKYTLALLKEGKKSIGANDVKLYNNIFDTYLGKEITGFNYNGKEITPVEYGKNVLRFNPDDYIEITSYTHHPFYEEFVLNDKFNWLEKKYLNVPLDDFMQIAYYAIDNGYSVCWDGDVTEETFDQENWWAYLPEGSPSNQQARQTSFEDGTTTIDHMMHLVGYGKDDKGATWFSIKNSWGKSGPNLGYFIMSEPYFKIKTVAIIVHKNAVPSYIMSKCKL